MAGRRIRNESDARESLNTAEASGLSRNEWAHQNGIDGRSLFAWNRKLSRGKKSRRSQAGGKLVRREGLVEVLPDPNTTRSRYLVRCGKLSVEVGEHFDEETLERLLRIVAAC